MTARCGLAAFLRSLCRDHVIAEKSRQATRGMGREASKSAPTPSQHSGPAYPLPHRLMMTHKPTGKGLTKPGLLRDNGEPS